jgi:hypothetical protein
MEVFFLHHVWWVEEVCIGEMVKNMVGGGWERDAIIKKTNELMLVTCNNIKIFSSIKKVSNTKFGRRRNKGF